MRISAVIAAITFLGVTPVQASVKAAAQVQAAKGPIQITLRIEKTKVKTKRYLWYKLELKNIGKTKLHAQDWIFKDLWAMHENCRSRDGIYLEIIGPDGIPLDARGGGGRAYFDWEPKGGAFLAYSPEEKKEIAALRADWNKRGMTERQQTLALNDWNNGNNAKKNQAELSDPAKQLWLRPGASTATVAWVNRGPGPYPGRSEDDESLRSGYAQLWSYSFLDAGKYRIRAVYDYAQPNSTIALFKKHGHVPSGWVKFKTPFIEFQVLP